MSSLPKHSQGKANFFFSLYKETTGQYVYQEVPSYQFTTVIHTLILETNIRHSIYTSTYRCKASTLSSHFSMLTLNNSESLPYKAPNGFSFLCVFLAAKAFLSPAF